MRTIGTALVPLVVLSVYAVQEANCFAPIPPSKWNARTQSGLVCRVATSNSTTTEATTASTATTPFDVLFQADPAVDAPLPPPYTDCPFTGIMAGPQSFYRQASEALRSPTLFSFLHRDQPTVEVRSGALVRELLNQEFSTLSSNAVAGISQLVCGTQSLRTLRDKQEHKAVRQLMGVPLAPAQVDRSIPRLEAIGRARIAEYIDGDRGEIVAWDMAQSMALDVVWQQILGLNLETHQEVDTFHQKTNAWLKGMWYKQGSPEFEATMESKEYMRAVIDQKINQLLEKGESDGSTVGGLVFATMEGDQDNENAERTLSRQEIIDNCLFLILGGTETTATNVANALWLMGLHPHVWQTVIEEQEAIVAQHGQTLTPLVLQSQTCPYLDAVIHEMMRILPLTLVSKRVATETLVLDGTQVPKGWGVSYNMYLTHQQDDKCRISEEEQEGHHNNNMHMDLIQGFQPERWLSPTTKPGKDYIPFGAGPRQCPGAYLAMTEMKAFLSLLAREMTQFELVTNNAAATTTLEDCGVGSQNQQQPIDEQIQWNKVSSLMTPEDGVRIRILPSSKLK